MVGKQIITTIFNAMFSDLDSCIIAFIGFCNAGLFAFGVNLQQIIIEPISLIEHIDKVFNLLITIFSFLILIRKYKNTKK